MLNERELGEFFAEHFHRTAFRLEVRDHYQGYAINIHAGAEVRMLDLAECSRPVGVPDEDFWLLDDEAVLIMSYDGAGRFLGADPAAISELPRYRRARDAAWRAAEPFADYWSGHPQYHRDQGPGR